MPFVLLVVISLTAGLGQALLATHGSLWLPTGYAASRVTAAYQASLATSQTDIQRCVAACHRRAYAAGLGSPRQ